MSDDPRSVEVSVAAKAATRRRLFTLLGAGGAAVIASQVGNKAEAANNDPLLLGHGDNIASSPTSMSADVPENNAAFAVSTGDSNGPAVALQGEAVGDGKGVHGRATGGGQGVFGDSDTGAGVLGYSRAGSAGYFSTESGFALNVDGRAQFHNATATPGGALSVGAIAPCSTALVGLSLNSDLSLGAGNGTEGHSGTGNGVHGSTVSGSGVDGLSNGSGNGVHGSTLAGGNGVQGSSPSGNGVAGDSDTGIGGRFESSSGDALYVVGRSRFSTAGAATIPEKQDSFFVANAAVGANSHVSVTLVSDPGPRYLKWVERSPGNGFTVRLSAGSAKQRPATSFTYLIVEPG